MQNLTAEIASAISALPDYTVVNAFKATASPSLYADGIGTLLGNLAEQAAAAVLGGRVMGGNQRGYDILLESGGKVQVKSRLRTTYRKNSQFMKGDPSSYDSWLGVSFNEDLSVIVAILLTASEVKQFGSASRFTERQLSELITTENAAT